MIIRSVRSLPASSRRALDVSQGILCTNSNRSCSSLGLSFAGAAVGGMAGAYHARHVHIRSNVEPMHKERGTAVATAALGPSPKPVEDLFPANLCKGAGGGGVTMDNSRTDSFYASSWRLEAARKLEGLSRPSPGEGHHKARGGPYVRRGGVIAGRAGRRGSGGEGRA